MTPGQAGEQIMTVACLDSLVLAHRYEMLDLQNKACYHRVRASEARDLSVDYQKGRGEDSRVLQVFGYPREMEREVATAFALQDFV